MVVTSPRYVAFRSTRDIRVVQYLTLDDSTKPRDCVLDLAILRCDLIPLSLFGDHLFFVDSNTELCVVYLPSALALAKEQGGRLTSEAVICSRVELLRSRPVGLWDISNASGSGRLHVQASYHGLQSITRATITYVEIDKREWCIRGKRFDFDLSTENIPLSFAEKVLPTYFLKDRDRRRRPEMAIFPRSHRLARSGRVMVVLVDQYNLKAEAYLMLVDQSNNIVLSDMAHVMDTIDPHNNSVSRVEKGVAFDGYSNTFAVINRDNVHLFVPKLE